MARIEEYYESVLAELRKHVDWCADRVAIEASCGWCLPIIENMIRSGQIEYLGLGMYRINRNL
jgi:hypothetical protein